MIGVTDRAKGELKKVLDDDNADNQGQLGIALDVEMRRAIWKWLRWHSEPMTPA